MVLKNFIRVKFCFEQVAYNFLHVFYAALGGIVFVYLYKIFQKNDNYEEFLTKFVNINNHTYLFLHGVLILQDAKNCSQHAKIFEA